MHREVLPVEILRACLTLLLDSISRWYHHHYPPFESSWIELGIAKRSLFSQKSATTTMDERNGPTRKVVSSDERGEESSTFSAITAERNSSDAGSGSDSNDSGGQERLKTKRTSSGSPNESSDGSFANNMKTTRPIDKKGLLTQITSSDESGSRSSAKRSSSTDSDGSSSDEKGSGTSGTNTISSMNKTESSDAMKDSLEEPDSETTSMGDGQLAEPESDSSDGAKYSEDDLNEMIKKVEDENASLVDKNQGLLSELTNILECLSITVPPQVDATDASPGTLSPEGVRQLLVSLVMNGEVTQDIADAVLHLLPPSPS